MARPVGLKYVVSFSSQDDAHSVQNLLKDGSYKKWLSDPKNRTGSMEAVFQLEKSCILSYLDIGTQMCSNISVYVGKSEWPQSREFEPLIRKTSLMTLVDVRLGRNTTNTIMFKTGDFCSDAASMMWDRIRIVCQQNFPTKVQFGLTFLRIKASKIEDELAVNAGSTDKFCKGRDVIGEESPKARHEKIQNHFFKGKPLKSPVPERHLETQLLKIASTSDSGPGRVEGLSRTAQILMAAQGSAGKYTPNKPSKLSPKTSGKKKFFAELITHNKSPLAKGKDKKAEENLNSKPKNLQNSLFNGINGNRPESPIDLDDLFSPVAVQLEGDLSRRAQMLKAAEERAGKFAPSKRYESSPSPSRKSMFFSEMKAQKESLSIQEEIDEFLSKLEIKPQDLESITIADLRHRFERKKKRKLTKEERKVFIDKVSDHISKIFSSQSSQSQDEEEKRPQPKRMRVEPPSPVAAQSSRHLPNSRQNNHPNTNQQSSHQSETNRFKNTFRNPRVSIPPVTSPNRDDIQFDLELGEVENTASCPLCGELFPLEMIEMHANVCADSQQFDLQYN